jgi:DNA polymerase-3 subunit delta'
MLTVGHEKQKKFLQKAFSSGRIPSAFAFIGKEGIGKKLLALEFAKGLLCGKKPFGCGECKTCQQVDRFIKDLQEGEIENYAYYSSDEGGKKHFSYLIGEHPDLAMVIPDGNQIKIDQIRDIQEFVLLKPLGNYKVVIIDDAGKMNLQAQNALLKILEEPPKGVVFILIASSKGELLPTILSRCQVLEFKPLKGGDIEGILSRLGFEIPPALRDIILADGSLAPLKLAEEEKALQLFSLIGDIKNLTFEGIIKVSEDFESLDNELRETLLGLLERFLSEKAVGGEIPLETYERVERLISETKRGLKRGIKAKLAMENILLTLKE